MSHIKKIDHLGIAVPELSKASELYAVLLGAKPDHLEEVVEQKVRTAFFTVGESHFELLEPTSPESPIAKFLEKRGPGLHHICIEVDDIEAALADYKKAGIALIDETPRRGAHNKRVAFVHPKSTGGVLLELSETPRSK